MIRAPFHFIEQIGHAVAGLGNIEIVGPHGGIFGVGVQQPEHVTRGPVGVLVAIAGVIPPATQVALGGGILRRVVAARVCILQGAEMAGAIHPAGGGKRRRLGMPGALVEKRAHRLHEHRAIEVVADVESRGADVALDV